MIAALVYSLHSGQEKFEIFGVDQEESKTELVSVLCQGEERKDYPDIYSLEENSLKAVSASAAINFKSLAVFSQGISGESHNETDITEYIVGEGDNLSSIAQQFNISLNTLLWANDLNSKSVISPSDKLLVLPVSGIMHIVREGDTISEVAEIYKGKVEEIVEINNLGKDGEIFVSDILIIPNGQKPVNKKTTPVYVKKSVPNSYFISPVPSPYWITQGLHWYNAIDFATGKCGSPIYAAAGGTVQKLDYGPRAGNYVRILHPNGVVTHYGHISKFAVSKGQSVSQGQVIGYIGYTGHTIPAGPSGCHLHFEVRGAANPFAY